MGSDTASYDSYDDLIARAPEPPVDRRAENRRRLLEAVTRRRADLGDELRRRLVGSSVTPDGRIDVHLTPGHPVRPLTAAILGDTCVNLFGLRVRWILCDPPIHAEHIDPATPPQSAP